MKGSMSIMQMLEISPVTVPQKKVTSQSLAWQIYLRSFHQLCLLLGIDDQKCGADWFGIAGPDGSLAVVTQPAIKIGPYLSWSMLWQLRLQAVYDLVQSMSACQKLTMRDEQYFRYRSTELIKLGIKMVEVIQENA